MSAVVVDTSALLRVVYSSLLAGVGICVLFALAIYGTTRAAEMRRGGRGRTASVYVAVAALAGLSCTAAAVYGVVLVAHKT